jgi:dTDP-4-dehydrorhamnose 3,5-epimerase
MPFSFEHTDLKDVIVVEMKAFPDNRGVFMEAYKRSDFWSAGIAESFVQDNISYSKQNVFRGLHYQNPPHDQAKLVTVLHGSILDVAVDIRRGSPTYARFVAVELSATNHRMMYVPIGFAHGFLSKSDETVVSYKVSREYAADFDRGIRWNDEVVGLELPVLSPLLSDKDARLPSLAEADNEFVFQEG